MASIHSGDRVVDPMDGAIRTVDYVDGANVYMNDGGVMDLAECESVYLESENPADDFLSIADYRRLSSDWDC